MKNKQAIQILKDHLLPVFESLGFETPVIQAGKYLTWRKEEQLHTLAFCCQLDKWPWDPWIGSRFVVEWTEETNDKIIKRARFADVANQQELDEVSELQNSVIAKFHIPTKEEYSEKVGVQVQDDAFFLDRYEDACQLVKYQKDRRSDIWFRYLQKNDVELWALFLARWISSAESRFLSFTG